LRLKRIVPEASGKSKITKDLKVAGTLEVTVSS
jgi:hypothetical protein